MALTRYLRMLKDSSANDGEFKEELFLFVEALMQNEDENSEKIVRKVTKKTPEKASSSPQKTKNHLSRTALAEQLFYPSTGTNALNQLARYIETHADLRQQLASSGYFSSTRGLTQEQAKAIASHWQKKTDGVTW